MKRREREMIYVKTYPVKETTRKSNNDNNNRGKKKKGKKTETKQKETNFLKTFYRMISVIFLFHFVHVKTSPMTFWRSSCSISY